jgi:SAM-dependent methyltransferase
MVRNMYEDADYAAAYAALDWGGTYYLVRRDLPGILHRHVTGDRALDFGCGAGRSTRLLRSYGFDVTGVDIADSMITAARTTDPEGKYVLLAEGDLDQLGAGGFDLVLAAFPFDNIPTQLKPDRFRTLSLSPPRSGPRVRSRAHRRYSGNRDGACLPVAERLCRTLHRIGPTRVSRPRHRADSGRPATHSERLRRLLLTNTNAPWLKQGCTRSQTSRAADGWPRDGYSQVGGLHHRYERRAA